MKTRSGEQDAEWTKAKKEKFRAWIHVATFENSIDKYDAVEKKKQMLQLRLSADFFLLVKKKNQSVD